MPIWLKSSRFAAAILSLNIVGSSPSAAADETLVKAAQVEGRVVWYTGLIIDQISRPMAEAFERAYRVKVDLVRANSSETALRISNEGKAGRVLADVFDTTTGAPALKRLGLVEKFVPHAAAGFGREMVDPEGYWTGINVYVLAGARNTDLVSDSAAPRSWEDYLDPKWRGRIAWSSSLSSAGAPGFIATVLKEYGEEKGMAYLKRLADQKVVSLEGAGRAVTDQIIAGEYALGLQIFNNQPATAARSGAPIANLLVQPATASLNTMSVTKGAPHPNAARLLMEFVTSTEGQQLLASRDYVPASPDVAAKDPALKPDGVRFRAIYFSPEELEGAMPRHAAIYKQLFR
jgi:ABC-type Fe3+ transport system substrate-binding protein